MRVATFEALPHGGARRVLRDFVRATQSTWDFEHFTVGRGDDTVEPTGGVLSSPRTERASRVLERLGFGGQLLASTRAQRRIARVIDSDGFDLAIVNHDAITHTPALLGALCTPSIYICHEPRRALVEFVAQRRAREAQTMVRRCLQAAAEPVIGAYERRWARGASLVVVNSRFSAESILRAYGLVPAVWHLGVDPGRFRRVDVTPDRPYVLSVGAMDPLKGHHLALEALSRLPAKDRPELHVVSDRGLVGYERMLQNLALERRVVLSVHRAASDAELVKLYSGALATLALGVLEPFGLTTIESMSCGTPVVGICEGGYREVVVEGVNGLLVDRSVQQLTRAIEAFRVGPALVPEEVRNSIFPYWSTETSAQRLADIAGQLLGENLRSYDATRINQNEG